MNTAEKIKSVKFGEAKSIVRQMLLTNNEWLVRGLVALLARQVEDEITAETTKYRNARGFNSSDAAILTSLGRQWQTRQWLSDRQMTLVRRKMLKYSGQLARIARGEETTA